MSGDNELFIYLKMVADQATSTSTRYHQGERQRIDKTAATQAKADADYIKAVKLKERASKDLAKAVESMDRDARRTQEKSDDEYVRSKKKALNAEAQLHKEMLRQKAREESIHQAAVKRNAEQRLAIYNREQQAWGDTSASVDRATASALRFGGAMVGLASAATVMSHAYEHFENIRKVGIDAASRLTDEAGKLRSLGGLQDQEGKPSITQRDLLKFRVKTLQSADDAATMRKAAMASAFGSIKSGIVSEGEMDKFMVTAGQLQTTLGESPEAIGKVAGALPMMMGKKKVTARDMAGMSDKIRQLQKVGGFDSYSQAAEQFGKVMPWVAGGMLTVEEAMGLLTAEAHGGQGAEAATRIDQLMRMTSMGEIRARHMKIDPAFKDEAQVSSEYMKSIGATGQRSFRKAELIAEDLMKADQAATAKGVNFDPLQHLGTKGQVNVESDFAAMQIFAMMKQGMWGDIKKTMGAPSDPNAIGKTFESATSNDPFFIREKGRMLNEIRVMEEGAKKQHQVIMMEQAFAMLGGEAHFGKPFEDFKDRNPKWDPREVMFNNLNQMRVEAARETIGEGRRVGTVGDKQWETSQKFGPWAAGVITWEDIFQLAQKNQAAGGDLVPGIGRDKFDSAVTRFEAAVDRWGTGGGGKPTPPGPPVKHPPVPLPPAAKAFQARIAASDAPWF